MALVSMGAYDETYARSIQLPKCNREACDDRFAPCFNKGTKTYYCVRCAVMINRANPGEPLCEIPDLDTELAMYEKYEAGQQYVGDKRLEDVPELLKTGYTTAAPSKLSLEIRVQAGRGKTALTIDAMRGRQMPSTESSEFDRAVSCPTPARVRHHLNVIDKQTGEHKILSIGQAAYSKILKHMRLVEEIRLENEAAERASKRAAIKKFNKRKKQARARTGRR